MKYRMVFIFDSKDAEIETNTIGDYDADLTEFANEMNDLEMCFMAGYQGWTIEKEGE